MNIDIREFEKIIPQRIKTSVYFNRQRKQLVLSEPLCEQLKLKPGDHVDIYRNKHTFILQKSKTGLFIVRYYNKRPNDGFTSCCLTGDNILLQIGTYIDDNAKMCFTVLENNEGLMFKQWEGEDDEQ